MYLNTVTSFKIVLEMLPLSLLMSCLDVFLHLIMVSKVVYNADGEWCILLLVVVNIFFIIFIQPRCYSSEYKHNYISPYTQHVSVKMKMKTSMSSLCIVYSKVYQKELL